MEILKSLGYINAMVGYCQSLRAGMMISEGYMQRMNDYYIPNTLKAAELIAKMLDKSEENKSTTESLNE